MITIKTPLRASLKRGSVNYKSNCLFKIALLLLALLHLNARAQTRQDTIRQLYVKMISRRFSISEGMASQFLELEHNYKTASTAIMTKKDITEDDRRAQANQLMQQKNAQLSQLLTPEQIIRIVPLGEMSRNQDTLTRLNQLRFIVLKLGVDVNKASKVNDVFLAYKQGLKDMYKNTALNTAGQQAAMSELATQRNTRLSALLTPAQMNLLYPAPPKVPIVRPPLPNQAIMAVVDTFQHRLQRLIAQKNLSGKDRQVQITELFKERTDSIRKVMLTIKQ